MVLTRTPWGLAFLALCLLLASLSPATEAKCQYKDVKTKNGKTYRSYVTAATTLSSAKGWNFLPTNDVCEATLIRDWKVPGSDKTLPYYMTTDVDTARLKRAVIVFGGKNRDSWSYFNLVRNARNLAGATQGINPRRIAVFSPALLTKADKDAGSVGPSDLYWKGDNWASGAESETGKVSTFTAIDALVDHISQQYPSIEQIVMAGHSMGAQIVNRYSTFRHDQAGSKPISYFIGNPGSWLWLDTSRPRQIPKNCADFDEYKYGLASKTPKYAKSDMSALGRKGVVDRIKRRNVHVLVGEKDNGAGDTRCQALTQGSNHRDRGTNYKSSMEKLNGGRLPASWTFDVVPGCTHDDWCMFHKNISLKYLFGTRQKRTRGHKGHGH